MLALTPCVSTEVGDAKEIVGDCGWIVAPSNARELSDAINTAIDTWKSKEDWDQLREKAHQRVIENYGLNTMVSRYQSV